MVNEKDFLRSSDDLSWNYFCASTTANMHWNFDTQLLSQLKLFQIIEFSLNGFTEFIELAPKNCNLKIIRTSCVTSWSAYMYHSTSKTHAGFSQTDKISNIFMIANFVFPCICSFLLNLQHMMLANVKFDISGCNGITFQGCRDHWSSSFLMVQLKRSWQYCHSCIVEILWKTLPNRQDL